MYKNIFIAFFLVMPLLSSAQSTFYELRIYHCNEGKLDDLLNRFRNHTLKLFEKHGMENIGYWVPAEGNEQVLYYVLGFPDKTARENSWKAFINDPEWQEVARRSELNGKIISKITSQFMTLNPALSQAFQQNTGTEPRLFEMRTYNCYPGKYPDIVKRFKDHTRALFEKHGMTNLMYFDTEDGRLLYFLAHHNADSAARSWERFRSDPDWIKVRDQSEESGKIVESIQPVFLKATDFSALR